MPNYDTVHHIPGKYNTIGPSTKYSNSHTDRTNKFELNKYYASSTCNLKPYQHNNKTSSNNLIDGQYFSNSLMNFNYPSALNYHQFVDNNTSSNAPYLQFQNMEGDLSMMGGGLYGSKHHIAKHHHPHHHHAEQTHHMHQQQINGSNNNIPWRHRQCPSIGSSSSSTSITSAYLHCEHCKTCQFKFSFHFLQGWDPSRHWLAVTSILLIAGAAGVAVPLALRVAAG